MIYDIKPHETNYNGTKFRSRLEARWAAFFDLVGWEWVYEPLKIKNWLPDFMIKIPCGHSECQSYHVLLVEIKPYHATYQFNNHPCSKYYFGGFTDGQIPFDSSAGFGLDPHVSYWEMAHGAGGGEDCISNWVRDDIDLLWREAGNTVQYKHEDKR
jgi:hypothetical protein